MTDNTEICAVLLLFVVLGLVICRLARKNRGKIEAHHWNDNECLPYE